MSWCVSLLCAGEESCLWLSDDSSVEAVVTDGVLLKLMGMFQSIPKIWSTERASAMSLPPSELVGVLSSPTDSVGWVGVRAPANRPLDAIPLAHRTETSYPSQRHPRSRHAWHPGRLSSHFFFLLLQFRQPPRDLTMVKVSTERARANQQIRSLSLVRRHFDPSHCAYVGYFGLQKERYNRGIDTLKLYPSFRGRFAARDRLL